MYRANHTHAAVQLDLSETAHAIEVVSAFKPDLLAGSPPCQDFSCAGKRVEGERACLTESFAHIAVAVRPRVVLIENVPELLNSLAFARARDLLEQASYQMLVLRVNAACCGVAQIRRRVFVIGVLGGSELMQQIKKEARSYSSTPADAPTVKHCIPSSSDTYYHPARTAHSACVRSTDR